MEMAATKRVTKKVRVESRGGQPYWERFYERRNGEKDNGLMTSEERELKEHCTGKPKLNEQSAQISSAGSGGKKVWERLLEVDRREIEKKREDEKLTREKKLLGQKRSQKNKTKSDGSVYDRLIQRASESAKQMRTEEESGDKIVS